MPTDKTDLASAAAAHRVGRLAEARAGYERVLAREPGNADALHLLGLLSVEAGQLEEAVVLMRRAIRALSAGSGQAHSAGPAPAVADIHSNMAGVLKDLGRPDEGLACLRRALALRADHPQTHNNLGVLLEACGRLDEAADAYQRAAGLLPGFTDALTNLAAVREEQGRADLAIAVRREALAGKGMTEAAGAKMHSDLLVCLHYTKGDDGPAMLAEHRAWARRYAEPLYPEPGGVEFANDRTPGRRLRVGLVSSDLRAHPVARFLEPVLEGRRRDAMEIYCYSGVARPDAVTARIRSRADAWRETAGVDDAELVRQIRADRVDVLVDLAGHMPGNRLLAFARRAAPVQVSSVGYPDTTGLETMDWRLTDAHHDPGGTGVSPVSSGNPQPGRLCHESLSGESQPGRLCHESLSGESQPGRLCHGNPQPGRLCHNHTEKLLRLPACAWCWRPDPDGPEVTGLPALRAGRVTFGGINRLVKLTPAMAALWARVLAAVPRSRLVGVVRDGAELGTAARQVLDPALRQAGVEPDRVVLVGRRPRAGHLRLYQEIDLALDTFPYCGQTNTCDAMWMGVPTVTLAGRTHVARTGVSLLSQVGLEELIADSGQGGQGYVDRAVGLAGDLDKLRRIRQDLRERMRHSPLMDARRIAGAWEQALGTAWRAWCECGKR